MKTAEGASFSAWLWDDERGFVKPMPNEVEGLVEQATRREPGYWVLDTPKVDVDPYATKWWEWLVPRAFRGMV